MTQNLASLTPDESKQLRHYLDLIKIPNFLGTGYHELEENVRQLNIKIRHYAENSFKVACKASDGEVKKLAVTQSNYLVQILASLCLFCRVYDQVKQAAKQSRDIQMCEKTLQSFYNDQVKPLLRYSEQVVDQPYRLVQANSVDVLQIKLSNFNSKWKDVIKEIESEKLELRQSRTKALFYGTTFAGIGIVTLATWCFDRTADTSKSIIYLTATAFSFAAAAASLIYKVAKLRKEEEKFNELLDTTYRLQGESDKMITELDIFLMNFIWKT